jgi:hypothetical protein
LAIKHPIDLKIRCVLMFEADFPQVGSATLVPNLHYYIACGPTRENGRPYRNLTRSETKMTAIAYEQDYYAWTQQTANLVRQGNFTDIDSERVAEEDESRRYQG